jgi:hypothetical protein
MGNAVAHLPGPHYPNLLNLHPSRLSLWCDITSQRANVQAQQIFYKSRL